MVVNRDANGRKVKARKVQVQKAAEIYVENKANNLGMTDQEVMVSAGLSEKTNPYQVKKSKTFQDRLEELMPKEQVVKRVKKGMDNPKDTTALGYVKVAAEMHGLTGRSNININNEGGTINLANLLGWKAPGEE